MSKQQHTPLIAQYLEIRQQYPDAMLFFQVGDFYELFFDDAINAANYLAITLTKRGKANGQDIPLCGVPVHALSHYLTKLVKGGYTVALCDQTSKPQPGTVVKRAVTKVYTPGTLIDEQLLDEKSASYLCTVFPTPSGTTLGVMFTELLTAHVAATTVDARDMRGLEAELARFSPDEVVMPAVCTDKLHKHLTKIGYTVTALREHADAAPTSPQELLEAPRATHWHENLSDGVRQQLSNDSALRGCSEVLYRYVARANPAALAQLTSISFYEAAQYVTLDAATLHNLAVVRNQEGSTAHTLFSTLDTAQTAMGSRLIKKWLVRPLRQHAAIVRRQQVVATFAGQVTLLAQLKEALRQIGDLERIVGRIALGRAVINDYLNLARTLAALQPLKSLLQVCKQVPLVEQLLHQLPDCAALYGLVKSAVNTDENLSGLIAAGYNEQLDQLRELANNGHAKIQELAARESQTHEIGSLKILYTSVAGYFIEVTKTHLDKVPEHYRQTQALANRARFITTELKELEHALSSAKQEVDEQEKHLYEQFEDQVRAHVPELRRMADALATVDALYALAQVAYTNNYVAPTFTATGELSIVAGRHPVVEQSLNEQFVANDTHLGAPDWLWIITGPNMGGKSTYLRQVALISLMAQCGSFVPAQSAQLSLVDRIFTRIGAGDNVAQGKSTFLVEMEETATICGQATKDSLVILDEVGRGTSTQDGRALAHAIIEYLAATVQSRTLFATHYHELTHLSSTCSGIANHHVQCTKQGDTLHFLHTLAPGVANASFGIDVAKLAHLPKSVIARARKLIATEGHTDEQHVRQASVIPGSTSTDAKEASPHEASLLAQLKDVDLDNLTPRAAFDLVCKLKDGL